MTQNSSTLTTFPNLTPDNLPIHNVWEYYPIDNAAPDNLTRHNLWEYYPNSNAVPAPTAHNVWDFYPDNYATSGNPSGATIPDSIQQ